MIKILPTPKHFEYADGDVFDVKSIYTCCEIGKQLDCALKMVCRETGAAVYDSQCGCDVIVTDNCESYFSPEQLDFFEKKFAHQQGYIIKKEKDSPVIIGAKSHMGMVYGLMTLLQLNGENIGDFYAYDYPDLGLRSNMWTVWAEAGIWSFDFGDGVEAIKKRIENKLDTSMQYKINGIYMDAFGLKLDRFEEYADIMRFANDRAIERGITIFTGTYGMSYGMSGYGDSYQGSTYLNRKSYPDGEIYECIGSYLAYNMITMDWVTGYVDRENRLTEVPARQYGTCMSNDELFEIKAKEFENYVRTTHCTGVYIHNMDSYEMHPELWKARCENCRQRWPNDDLYARDGAAGAFAYYYSKLANRLKAIKDGDFDGSRDLKITVVSPGYCYAVVTSDSDFEQSVSFWAAVSRYLETDIVSVGFREQFFYFGKNEPRLNFVKNAGFECDVIIVNFNGADGFYDDKLFTVTSAFNYIMKGADGMITASGNAFQEPLQLFNAEYQWCQENSSFYNIKNKPADQREFIAMYNSAIASKLRPHEIYAPGGMLDFICQRLYGEAGAEIAEVFRICGEDGEPPIVCASCVDIYTAYTNNVYPMRWDNSEITDSEIADMTQRFFRCADASRRALRVMEKVLLKAHQTLKDNEYLNWIHECLGVGTQLCDIFYKYMQVYSDLHRSFADGTAVPEDICERIFAVRDEACQYLVYVDSLGRKCVDRLGGGAVRRKEMGEHVVYWTDIMESSVRSGKRIPDDARPLAVKQWW